ncbi:hypothetical protein MIR68_000827, partial [Amoeboaphelidium protococcarum]
HHKRDLNTVTIKSRTLVFRGWDLLLLSVYYVYEQLQAHHPEFISVDRVGRQTFVTFATHQDAANVMRQHQWQMLFHERVTAHYAFNSVHIDINQQARFTGHTNVNVMALTYHTMKKISSEIGSDYLRRYWRDIHRRLSRQQYTFGQQYGGVWLGGLVVEDPSPTTGRAHSPRFVRFAVDRDMRQRVEVLRQQLPTFHRDEVATLALPWLQELDSQRQLPVSELRDFLRDYERQLVALYGGCAIYEIYHRTLKMWLRRRFEQYMNRNR